MFASLVLAYCAYFAQYPQECTQTLSFIASTPTFSKVLCKNLNYEETIVAESIVAPEISQYSPTENDVQIRTLYLMYVKFGTANFSVGYLQMKPSFAEQIESLIQGDTQLKRKYQRLVIKESDISKKRRIRLERLSSLRWELEYLSAFMQIATKRLAGTKLTTKARIMYLATMYNSGVSINIKDIPHILRSKHFPHWSYKQFNYAECVLEFYNKLKSSKRKYE